MINILFDEYILSIEEALCKMAYYSVMLNVIHIKKPNIVCRIEECYLMI